MEWLSKITELAKLPTKFFVIAVLVTGSLLSLPDRLLKAWSLGDFLEVASPYLALILITSLAFLVVELGLWAYRKGVSNHRKFQRSKKMLEKVYSLDAQERSIVREFFFEGATTLKMPIDHPAVAELLDSGVLARVGTLGERSVVGSLFSVKINDEVKAALSPKLIGIEEYLMPGVEDKWQVTDAGARWIHENRPSFMRKIEEDRALFEGRLW